MTAIQSAEKIIENDLQYLLFYCTNSSPVLVRQSFDEKYEIHNNYINSCCL